MPRLCTSIFVFLTPMFASAADTADLTRVFVDGTPAIYDSRFNPPRRVSEGKNFRPWSDRAAWNKRLRHLHEQAAVAAGLWPMPDKCPLNTTITATIDCGDYTVENVYFSSYPGFYVTGSLFRPKGAGPFPAV